MSQDQEELRCPCCNSLADNLVFSALRQAVLIERSRATALVKAIQKGLADLDEVAQKLHGELDHSPRPPLKESPSIRRAYQMVNGVTADLGAAVGVGSKR